MIQREVSAKVPIKEGRNEEELTAVAFVNYAEDLDEALDMFGEEAILSNAWANWKVTLQSNIRSSLISGLNEAAVQEKLANAKMGAAQIGGRVDAQTAFIAKFKMATPEKQAEMLEMLREAAEK